MNTNVITQRLATVIGPKAKENHAVIKKDSGALESITMGLAAAVVVASVAPALPFDGNATQMASLTEDLVTATEGYPNPGGNHVSTYPSTPPSYYSVMPPLTTGRSALGAIPRHYEYNRNGVRD